MEELESRGIPGGDHLFSTSDGWFGGNWWAVNDSGLFHFTP
jgi:hypothetical protein